MDAAKEVWFTYEPLPHTDKGIIYCEGAVSISANVIRSDFGKKFRIEYEGNRTPEIEAILQQMNEWFYHTHVKDAEDNEF